MSSSSSKPSNSHTTPPPLRERGLEGEAVEGRVCAPAGFAFLSSPSSRTPWSTAPASAHQSIVPDAPTNVRAATTRSRGTYATDTR